MGNRRAASLQLHWGVRSSKGRTPGNFVLGPASIILALFLAMKGARDTTLEQLQNFIGHETVLTLPKALSTLPADPEVEDGDGYGGTTCDLVARLYASPAIGAMNAFHTYCQDVKTSTGGTGEAAMLPVGGEEPPEAVINRFIREATRGRITAVAPPGSVSAHTMLLLVSVAYFKAGWHTPFDEHETRPRVFHALRSVAATPSGRDEAEVTTGASASAEESLRLQSIKVPTMQTKIKGGNYLFKETKGYLAVGLFYKDTSYLMTVMMPKRYKKLPLLSLPSSRRREHGYGDMDFPTADEVLEELIKTREEMKNSEMKLYMPKFKLVAERNTVDLRKMFMDHLHITSPFVADEANFSKIGGEGPCGFLEAFLHAAEIVVEEKGTTASAATVSFLAGSSAPPPFFSASIDRPFLFQIVHVGAPAAAEDGATAGEVTVLFSGEVVDPTSAQ